MSEEKRAPFGKNDAKFAELLALGVFSVDSNGAIFRNKRMNPRRAGEWKIVDPPRAVLTKNRGGYIVVCQSVDGIEYKSLGHRVVWIAANGLIPNGVNPNHINGNPSDNRLENLELVTQKQNIHHSLYTLKRGGTPRGSKLPFAKLTEEQVLKAIELRKQGMYPREIAAIFNVSTNNIAGILNGRHWRWLTGFRVGYTLAELVGE